MSKPEPSLSQNSSTTGFQPVMASSAIGSLLGGTGCELTLQESSALAQLRPADTDRRVADALQHISGRPPVFRRRTMFPESGPTYSTTEAASWKCDDADQQQRGLVAVNFSLRPAPEAKIAQALYELRTLTRGRVNREASEDEAEALIWTQHLRQYPADIVLHTLKNWPARSDGQWWPTWHDIHKIVEAETVARRMLAEHIRTGKCLPAPKANEVDPDDSPEPLARRKAQADAARERFGIKPSTGETVVDREAMPEALRAERDREVAKAAAKLKGERFELSDEAKAIFREGLSDRVVPSPDEQFDNWSKGERAA